MQSRDDENLKSKPTGTSPRRMPDTLVIIFVLAAIAWVSTYLFKPGRFAVGGEDERIVPGSFETAGATMPAPVFGDANNTGFLDFLFAGLVTGDRYSATVGLMAFIIILGGVFGMIMKTRSIDAAVGAALPNGKARDERLLVGLFVVFSMAGAIFGLSEEAIALTLVLTPALTRAGYDSITALLVCLVASQIGFATSWMNPFSVIVAQSISEIAPMSGLEYRAALWAIFTFAGAAFTWQYGRGVRLGLRRAARPRIGGQDAALPRFSRGHLAILITLLAGVAWVAWGVMLHQYYLPEIAAQFFTVGILVVLIARMAGLEGSDTASMMQAFRQGAADLLPAAIIVGAAKGILLMLGGDDPAQFSLLNSLLHALSSATAAIPGWLTAWAMFLVQSGFNFFVASGSGQAGITMPIMAPLADLSGVTRQSAVLAFQLGDGLTNLVVPTSAVLIASLAAARVGYGEWLSFAWRPMLALMVMASAAMFVAQIGGY